VSLVADNWLEQLQPWLSPDLQDFVNAVSTMWAQVETYAFDDPDDGRVGWQALWDVDIAPPEALPWLAQIVGERLPSGLSDAQQRDWIRMSPIQDRGSPQAIVNAVRRLLDPPALVQFRERSHLDGTYDDDTISVLTFASQTPDPAAVREALRRNVPADIVWEYDVVTGATWAGVETGMADWTDLESTYGPTWANVAGATPGFIVWGGV
jgi:hypothetical protein